MNYQELKKDLPIGAMTEISKLSGVNSTTVQRFFNGEKTKFDIKIIQTTTQYLKDYKETKAKALQELQAVAKAV